MFGLILQIALAIFVAIFIGIPLISLLLFFVRDIYYYHKVKGEIRKERDIVRSQVKQTGLKKDEAADND